MCTARIQVGHFGLFLEESLDKGHSRMSATYDNPPLLGDPSDGARPAACGLLQQLQRSRFPTHYSFPSAPPSFFACCTGNRFQIESVEVWAADHDALVEFEEEAARIARRAAANGAASADFLLLEAAQLFALHQSPALRCCSMQCTALLVMALSRALLLWHRRRLPLCMQ